MHRKSLLTEAPKKPKTNPSSFSSQAQKYIERERERERERIKESKKCEIKIPGRCIGNWILYSCNIVSVAAIENSSTTI
jgi:hypothetical protein